MSYEHLIREDFERRLGIVKESFNRGADLPVLIKLIELNHLCPTSVYALFEKINVCGFESLDKLENLLSIVGNFYDDSFFDVIWEVPSHTRHFPKPTSYPYIIQVNDDRANYFTEEKFCEVIQWYIDWEVNHQRNMAELDKKRNK